MLKTCIKCGVERQATDFYYHGKTCIKCQKGNKYDYSIKVKIEGKMRKCLMCDKKFVSFGNRRCDSCNLSSRGDDSVSSYLSVG
jgi:hypothetical protein